MRLSHRPQCSTVVCYTRRVGFVAVGQAGVIEAVPSPVLTPVSYVTELTWPGFAQDRPPLPPVWAKSQQLNVAPQPP